jgi:hypothetical protein
MAAHASPPAVQVEFFMTNSLKVPAAQVGTLANVRGLPDAARTAPEVAKQSSTACGRLAACKS